MFKVSHPLWRTPVSLLFRLILSINALLLATVAMGTQAAAFDLLIENATVIDVRTGKAIPNSMVAVEGSKITYVGPNDPDTVVKAGTVIDGTGKYIIPGIWDMHVHLEGTDLIEDNELLFPVFLAHGITTVRDAASDLGEQVLIWRDEINEGKRQGPTIYTAGRKLEGIDSLWKGDLEIGTEKELASMLDYLEAKKVDFVKITENTLKGPLFLKSIQEAKARGFKVSTHIPQGLTIPEMVDSGLSSIEHASYMLRLGADHAGIVAKVKSGQLTSAEANALYRETFSQEVANKAYAKLGQTDLAVTPTLIGGGKLAYLAETDHSDDALLQYLTKRFTSKYQWRIDRMKNDTAADKQARKDRYALIKAQLVPMHEAGITLLAGSDSAAINTYVYPAQGLHEELEIFEDAGLIPADILRMATLNGADFMGDTMRGELLAGKQADIVILNSNPLETIRATQDIEAVIKGGQYFSRARLDTMLHDAASRKQALDAARQE
ncbi:amidohydrolase [Kordiimonas sediminis]|uniref:Amidohydrolase n=1 Tax=Kordiimonas sediminis TaxID=1735581 RepID=A0A919AT41_9PROT|nr:amidohydrolase family protein [Kordiimonas sediminis]GHF22845.1 amidohydrolase [Kordiimonas sediminis]